MCKLSQLVNGNNFKVVVGFVMQILQIYYFFASLLFLLLALEDMCVNCNY